MCGLAQRLFFFFCDEAGVLLETLRTGRSTQAQGVEVGGAARAPCRRPGGTVIKGVCGGRRSAAQAVQLWAVVCCLSGER